MKRLDIACKLESISIEVKLPPPPPPRVPIEIFNVIDNLFYRLGDENKECITIGDINCNSQGIVLNTLIKFIENTTFSTD